MRLVRQEGNRASRSLNTNDELAELHAAKTAIDNYSQPCRVGNNQYYMVIF